MLVKPPQWNLALGLVAPEWRWFWKQVLIAPALWERGGLEVRDYACQTLQPMVGMAVNDWEDEGITFGSGNNERLRLDHARIPTGIADITIFYVYKTTYASTQATLSGARAGLDNAILIFHTSSTNVRFYTAVANGSFTNNAFPAAMVDGDYHAYMFERNDTDDQFRSWFDDPFSAVEDKSVAFSALNLDLNGFLFGQEQDSVDGGFQSTQKARGTLKHLYVFDGFLSDAHRTQLFLDPSGPFRMVEQTPAWLIAAVATGGWPHNVGGIANANVFGVGGVAKSNIAKVGGVA